MSQISSSTSYLSSSNSTSNSNSNSNPERVKIIPNNAFDLMKHIRQNENKNSMRTQVQANRILKQELQREMIEKKLMEIEDYIYTDEGKRREKAYEDRLHMEAEDMYATQIEKILRDTKKLDFREKIRREAEERKKQEEIERQHKLEAAEKRRQAVVERIRKKKEEEEAAIRRAEEAKLREIAEKERLIQLAQERIRSDRAMMEMEDELSMLAEQLYKEYLEKLKWKKEEEARIAAWEEEQRKKDELEAEKRKERLAELEAKKAKLAELRKAQMLSSGIQDQNINKEEIRIKDVQQAREEAIKLGKQMRIQNKAKYVSKKRKEEPNDVNNPSSSLNDNDNQNNDPNNLVNNNNQKLVKDENKDNDKLPNSLQRSLSNNTLLTSNPAEIINISDIDQTIIQKINNSSTEAELYHMQKELMVEKRALRIEIMTESQNNNNTNNTNNINNINNINSTNKLSEKQNQVNKISVIEKYIQNKMDQIVTNKDKLKDHIDDNQNQISSSSPTTTSINNQILGGNEITINQQNNLTSSNNTVQNIENNNNNNNNNNNVNNFYSNIEKYLQEINEITLKYGIIDLLSVDKDPNKTPRKFSNPNNNNNNFDYVSIIRRSTLLKMQMTEYLTKINIEDDVIGYHEKINDAIVKITQFIEKHQHITPQKPPLPRSNSITPSILQKINSFSSLDGPSTPPKTRPPKKIIQNEEISSPSSINNNSNSNSKNIDKNSNEVSEATSAIGKKLLNLVRHDQKSIENNEETKTIIDNNSNNNNNNKINLTLSNNDNSNISSNNYNNSNNDNNNTIFSPRRKLGIAEMKEKDNRNSTNKNKNNQLNDNDEPYIVSPRTRKSPRLVPIDSPNSISTIHNNNNNNNDNNSTTLKNNTNNNNNNINNNKTKVIQQKPLIHTSNDNNQKNIISAPVLISTHTKKVNGHIAIEITDLEDNDNNNNNNNNNNTTTTTTTTTTTYINNSNNKINNTSRKNSLEDKCLKSFDSCASILSTGISDVNENNWWGGNESQDNYDNNNKLIKRKTSKQENLSSRMSPDVEEITTTAPLDSDNNDDDEWWNQAGSLENNNYDEIEQKDSDNNYNNNDNNNESIDNYNNENNEYGSDYDYNSIPGWIECLHTTMATAAHHAAFYGYTQVLEVLSYYFDVFQMDKNGRTPLFYASLRNNLDCVLLLVSIDPQWIEVGDTRGDTAIHAAAISNGIDVLSFLLSCDINPNIANYEGLTPIHLSKSVELLTILYNVNATMYCVDNYSRMPLWYRCKDGNKDAVDLLCRIMPSEYIIWQDFEGNTPLHIACMNGHEEIVEILCQWYTKFNDYYICNKKNYTIVHVAKTSSILKKLYEYGIDLWIADSKQRYPLFINSFQGKVDCVILLIEIAIIKNNINLISAKDFQGDTALHAACLTGNIQCISILLYYIRDTYNKSGLLACELAYNAGYHMISKYVYNIEQRKLLGETSYDIYQCTFDELVSILLYYGTRWCKLYDINNNEVYYYDRILQLSQWHKPEDYDEPINDELLGDKARNILITFYLHYNPEKLCNLNEIMSIFKNKYSELFLQLAERYHVEDLSIFSMD